MDFTITTIFYLLVGCGVGVAFALREQQATPLALIGKPLAAALFWPLFVPLLLEDHRGSGLTLEHTLGSKPDSSKDGLTQAIEQVEGELEVALQSLRGWPGAVLTVEPNCFDELRAAWRTQADHIRELERLLGDNTFRRTVDETPMPADKRTHSERARQDNIARLNEIRDRLCQDLLGTIAWVRELVTMIHLAKYTGAPASRAEELVRQIATAVEGLSHSLASNAEHRPC